jgi:hypothetical protein
MPGLGNGKGAQGLRQGTRARTEVPSIPVGLHHGERTARVPSVECRGGLEQKNVDLFGCNGAMLDTARNDEELAFVNRDGAVAKLHCERTA